MRDRGYSSVETVLLMTVVVIIGLFLSYVGRLNGAGVQVANAAQAAARSASLAGSATDAGTEMNTALAATNLSSMCIGGPTATIQHSGSDWYGSTVSVTVSCTVQQRQLAGFWVPGKRTLSVTDTQAVEQFRS